MPGRPRLPDAVKQQRGTFQSCRSNPDAPPVSHLTPQEMPRWIIDQGDDAVEIYSSLVMMLDGMKVLSFEDMHVVALAASALAEVRQLSAIIVDEGPIYETRNAAGEYMKRGHPAVSQRADAARRAQSLLMQMGLTPATRATVGQRKDIPNNPFAELDG